MANDTCIFNKYQSYYNLIGIISLFLILISSLIYYLYITRKPKNNNNKNVNNKNNETFENNGCFFENQGSSDFSKKINVEMRDCEVYFTDKEDDCDKYFNYYEMTTLELDREILKSSSDNILNKKLIDIKKDKEDNLDKINVNQCKYKFDGWKELNKYLDDSQPDAKDIIYPHKNTSRNPQDSVYKNLPLLNSCFKEYIGQETDINISTEGNFITKACVDRPINKLNNINNQNNDQKYLSVNFNNNLPFDSIKNNICKNLATYSLDINNSSIFIKLNCYYNDNNLYINDISFIHFNNNNYEEITDINTNNNILSNFFRISYNKSLKEIYYGSKTINTNTYLLNYDICNNIKSKNNNIFNFSFKDFLIENKTISTININELINLLYSNIDDSDNTRNYLTDINSYILDLDGIISSDIIDKSGKIKLLEEDNINISSYISNIDSKISSLEENIRINNNKIRESRQETDNRIADLLESVQNARLLAEQARISAIERNTTGSSSISSQNRSISIKNQAIQKDIDKINAANKLITDRNNALQKSINDEYTTTIHNNQRNYQLALTSYNTTKTAYDQNKLNYDTQLTTFNNNMVIFNNNFKTNFQKGLYFWKKDYNSGNFRNKWMDSEKEFTDNLNLNNYYKNQRIIVSNPIEDFFHDYDSSYIKKFPNAPNSDYFTLEISGNIKFERSGYYNFYINGDDATDFFIGYRNASGNMIFKCVSHYYGGHGPSFNCYTTNKPIYIDANYNGGYYGLYMRFHELWGGAYINPYFSEVSSAQLKSIYNDQFYNLRIDSFSYYHKNNVNSSIINNKKSLNLLNNNRDCFYVNKNNSDRTSDSFYINYPSPVTVENPGPSPVRPNPPANVIKQRFTPASLQPVPRLDSLLSYTPINIPPEYVDTSSSSINELRSNRDTTISTYNTTIENDSKTINNNKQEKIIKTRLIDNNNSRIEIYRTNIADNNENLKNLSSIKDKIRTFSDYYTFDYIKTKIQEGVLIENINYKNNVFQDNLNNKYIFIDTKIII